MSELTPKMRVLLFLYSTQNLFGCCMALVGLGLFFGGVIDDWWLPITIGLYAAGWLLVPADKSLEFKLRTEATQADLIAGVEDLLAKTQFRLPGEALAKLEHILTIIKEMAPRIFSGDMAMGHAIDLTNAITRDLPETISNYLKLPTAFANYHTVDGGKTCKAMLIEQLDLLDTQLTKMAESTYRDDAEALMVNGRFLKEKFHPLSFVNKD